MIIKYHRGIIKGHPTDVSRTNLGHLVYICWVAYFGHIWFTSEALFHLSGTITANQKTMRKPHTNVEMSGNQDATVSLGSLRVKKEVQGHVGSLCLTNKSLEQLET